MRSTPAIPLIEQRLLIRMDITVIYTLLSAVLGCVLAFVLARSRYATQIQVRSSQLDQATTEIQTLRDELQSRSSQLEALTTSAQSYRELIARLETRLQQIDQLQQELDLRTDQMHQFTIRLQQEIELRSVAEEKARKIPILEQTLTQAQARIHSLMEENALLSSRISELETTLREQRKATERELQILSDAKSALSDTFMALSQEALKSNNQSFLDLARERFEQIHTSAKGELQQKEQAIRQLLDPIKENLDRLDYSNREMERIRTDAYAALQEQIKMLRHSDEQLRTETSKLVTALRAPKARGQWGEVQLRRVVEMAGMMEHCNFNEQVSLAGSDARLIADMVIHLPGGKSIVVDSKAPLDSYLAAMDASDETERSVRMSNLCGNIRKHVDDLFSKEYWTLVQPAPDFMVLFMPSESVFYAALQTDPTLMDYSVNKRVLLTSPTTLIGMLKSIAYGWRQEALAENAMRISELGREIYDRFRIFGEHMSQLGKNLSSSVQSYNNLVSSTENRLLVSARKFKELGVAHKDQDLTELRGIDRIPSPPHAIELRPEETPAATGGTLFDS